MKRYDGSAPDDKKPLGGGSYNSLHKGNELYNFHRHRSWVYGFVQPPYQGKTQPRRLKLSRILPGHNASELQRVLIIFIARLEGTGPQVVVGWHRNSTVYLEEKTKRLHGRSRRYFARTRTSDACLLRSEARFQVSRHNTGLGQANVSYPFDDRGKARKISGLQHLLKIIASTDDRKFLPLCNRCYALPRKRRPDP